MENDKEVKQLLLNTADFLERLTTTVTRLLESAPEARDARGMNRKDAEQLRSDVKAIRSSLSKVLSSQATQKES